MNIHYIMGKKQEENRAIFMNRLKSDFVELWTDAPVVWRNGVAYVLLKSRKDNI